MSPEASELAAEHMDLAARIARHLWPLDSEEAESIAMVTLCEAAENWCGGTDKRFGTYLYSAIRFRLIDEFRKLNGRRNQRKPPLSLDRFIGDSDSGWVWTHVENKPIYESGFDAAEDADAIRRLPGSDRLSDAQLHDLALRSAGYYLHEIAARRGVSEAAVCFSLKKAAKKIREAA